MERHWPPSWRAWNFALYAGAEHRQQFRHRWRLRRDPDAHEERTHCEAYGSSTEADAQIRDVGHHKDTETQRSGSLIKMNTQYQAARPLCLCVFVVTSLVPLLLHGRTLIRLVRRRLGASGRLSCFRRTDLP